MITLKLTEVKKPLAFSQSTIDEFIRLGGCTRQSPERIYGYYRRANDTAENVAFLKSEYEKDSVGLIIDGKKMSAVWNEDGVRIAEGEKVDGAWRSVFLTWEDVDKRTRELIELGQYITNDRAEQADEIYENHLADKIAFLYREYFADLPDEDKTESRFIWPEITEFYKTILHDPQQLEAFCEEMDRNITKKEAEGRRHSSVYHPRLILMLTKQFLREPIEFARADEYLVPQKMFVTQDRIMEEIAGHHPIGDFDKLFPAMAKAIAHADFAKGNQNYRASDYEFSARCAAYAIVKKYGRDATSLAIHTIPHRYPTMEAEDIKKLLGTVKDEIKGVSERMNAELEPQREANKDKQTQTPAPSKKDKNREDR